MNFGILSLLLNGLVWHGCSYNILNLRLNHSVMSALVPVSHVQEFQFRFSSYLALRLYYSFVVAGTNGHGEAHEPIQICQLTKARSLDHADNDHQVENDQPGTESSLPFGPCVPRTDP